MHTIHYHIIPYECHKNYYISLGSFGTVPFISIMIKLTNNNEYSERGLCIW